MSNGVFVRYSAHGAWHVAHSWDEPQADLPLSIDLPEFRHVTDRRSMVALCGFAAPWTQMTEQTKTATLQAFMDSLKGLHGGILSHSACDHCLLLEARLREATPEEIRAMVALRREALTDSLRVLPF